jgi:hypothetical protein
MNDNFSTKNVTELTIKEILKRISEYDIFKYYVGKDFKMGSISSPFRKDRNPSFDIYPSRGTVRKIMYKDHTTGDTGSCFDLVMIMHAVGFGKALDIINHDFNLELGSNYKSISPSKGFVGKVNNVDISKLEVETKIRVVRRDWNSSIDKEYWSQYGITCKTLKLFNVAPLEAYFINNRCFRLSKRSCVYCYYFGNYKYKILQPTSNLKWLSNASFDIIQGWHMLPEKGDLLIITKSLKDVMVFYELGISAIAPQGEGVIPSEKVINELKKRFDTIVSNYDFDRVGIKGALKMRRLYNIPAYMFNASYDVKDVSDFVKNYSLTQLKQTINDLH